MTTRFLAPMLITASAFASALPGIDPVLLNVVMPDAKLLTGIQVDQTLASPFGQYLLSKMQPDDPGFVQFITATGFDPRKNLNQILAATGSTTADGSSVLVLGRGTFVPSQIASAAITAGASVTTYNNTFTVITPPSDKSNTSVLFLDGSTVAIGSIAMIEAAADRFAAHANYSGSLATSAQTASLANSAWFATVTPLSDFLSGKLSGGLDSATQSNLFQSITAASGGINFGSNTVTLTGDAVTTSNQNAQALVNVLQFVVSMIQTNANDQTVNTLANAATFAANGSTTHMSLALTEQQAEQLFMNAGSGQSRPARKKRVQ